MEFSNNHISLLYLRVALVLNQFVSTIIVLALSNIIPYFVGMVPIYLLNVGENILYIWRKNDEYLNSSVWMIYRSSSLVIGGTCILVWIFTKWQPVLAILWFQNLIGLFLQVVFSCKYNQRYCSWFNPYDQLA